MHVTRVELENIKSYERAAFNFHRGTTAITGENGAGKTTILEAIAWALFDTLEYSKDDFLRRGARRGSVRVTFESDLDGRQYTVYRDTGQGYYIFDHGLNLRIAEKKTDVSATLRQHLGIEPGTDLKGLFRSAIGVPQGSFTAEFLLAPNARKAAFDRLLKVEEYRDGAERLIETVHLIRERTSAVNERIANADGQLARYDELVAEQQQVSTLASELAAMLRALRQQIKRYERAVQELNRAELLVAETRSRLDRAEVERDAATRRLTDAQGRYAEAEAAYGRQREVEAAHKAHLAARERLDKLETERATRDRLLAESNRSTSLAMEARAHTLRLEDALERAAQAAISLAALSEDIKTQEELERERDRLRDLRAQAMSARARLTPLDAELEQLRRQHVQTRESIREAERGRDAEARQSQLESERLHIETSLSTTERAATSLKHLENQRREATREVERLRREIGAQERELAELERHAASASEAANLLARESELTEQLAHLRAEIARDEKFHAEVRNGLCPILSERCLNIGEDQTLEDYFKGQYASQSAQLKVLEKERAEVGRATRVAREAEKHLSRLESVGAQASRSRALLSERLEALARLEDEIKALPLASRERLNELRAQLSGIDAELITVREAALRYAEIKPLKVRLKEIEEEGKLKKEERASVAAIAEGLAALEGDISSTEQCLRSLNDPRGRAASLSAEAERETALQGEIAGARDALRALDEQSQALKKALEQYTSLDAEWEQSRAERDRTAEAHHEYLTSETIAATRPARQAEMQQAEAEAARASEEAARALAHHERAARDYNREQHVAEQAALAEASKQEAATQARLEAADVRKAALDAEIARLSQVREQRRDDFLERDRLKEKDEATEFIRDTLKKAGPLITESYLYNISIEANQLFREITGDAGRALRWSRDYEIILEEEGHERSFQNLSGGEQMAAALSVRLALLKQLSDIRLAFFDEPTVNMDAERRERLAQQIGQIQHFDQLFVISHDDTFEESVDHIIHVERNTEGMSAGRRAEG